MEKVNGRLIEWGVASRTLEGESKSGDMHLVKTLPGRALVAVIDGLGHGQGASQAAQAAVEILQGYAGEPLADVVRQCHRALVGTRGAVMSLAAFSAADSTMTWVGVGNVEGMLLRHQAKRSSAHEGLVLKNGLLGDHLPMLSVSVLRVEKGDVLIFATDGIRPGFADRIIASDPPQQIADQIMAWLCRGADDALVLVARYVKG